LSRMNLRLLRGLAGATTLALLATALLSNAALAANGRQVYFGSPDSGDGGGYTPTGDLDFGALTNTRVTANNKTAVIVLIRNDDNQALNHVKVAGGAAADAKPYNLGFDKPDTTSLPAGASFVPAALTILSGPAGATCGTNTAASFECSIGSLAAGASASLQVVIKAPNNVGANPYWFTGSWNEGWSSTGTNADYNFAVDNLDTLAATCANGTSSWFLSTETVELTDGDTSSACVDTSASVKSGAALGGGGGFAQVLVDATAAACPATITKCYGQTVDVKILAGAPVPGGVIWTMQFMNTKTLGGIVHYKDNYNPNDPATYDVIPLTKKFKCGETLTTNCWNTVTPSPGGVKPVYVIVEFVTASNGKGGGWI
jgi:hypothetical protein